MRLDVPLQLFFALPPFHCLFLVKVGPMIKFSTVNEISERFRFCRKEPRPVFFLVMNFRRATCKFFFILSAVVADIETGSETVRYKN